MSTLTKKPFYPGRSPCDGDCDLFWARNKFRLPQDDVEMKAVVLPTGSTLHGMTYAKDEEAFWSPTVYEVMFPLEAEGYRLSDGRWFVKINACQNWTVAEFPIPAWSEENASQTSSDLRRETLPYSTSVVHSDFAGRSNLSSTRGDFLCCVVLDDDPVPPPPVEIPPVPLPSSALMLVCALLMLAARRRR